MSIVRHFIASYGEERAINQVHIKLVNDIVKFVEGLPQFTELKSKPRQALIANLRRLLNTRIKGSGVSDQVEQIYIRIQAPDNKFEWTCELSSKDSKVLFTWSEAFERFLPNHHFFK